MSNLNDVIMPTFPSSHTTGDDTDDFEPIPKLETSPHVSLLELTNAIKSRCSSASAQKLNIINLNCESLYAKIDQIKILIEKLEMDNCRLHVICLQETWLNDNSEEFLSNYKSIHQPKSISERGGLTMFIHNSINFKIMPSHLSTVWECQLVEIKPSFGNKKMSVCNVYRPPSVKNYTRSKAIEVFIAEFSNYIGSLPARFTTKFVCGDFNLNLLKSRDDNDASNFIDAIFANGFIPKITLPTRYSLQYGSSSLIDNILVKSRQSIVTNCYVLTHKISDHFACFLSIEVESDSKKPSSRYVSLPANTSANHEKFRILVSEAELMENIDDSPDADPLSNYNKIESILTSARIASYPTKKVKFDKYIHRKNPWITSAILVSIQFRDDLSLKVRNAVFNSCEWHVLKKHLDMYKKYLRSCIRLAKKMHFNKIFDQCKNDIKQTWKSINSLLNRNGARSALPECFNIDGSLISDRSKLADAFNKFFINIGPKLASTIDPPVSNVTYESFLTDKPGTSFEFSAVNYDSVVNAIDSLKNKTSCGYDQISNQMLKSIKVEISPVLVIIINQCLETCVFPPNLKLAKVSPIFKKGDNIKIDNYRPISLLPVISKIFEKVLHQQLMNYFVANSIFFPHQYGFRPKHSTEHATLELIDHTLEKMNDDNIPLSIFIDLSKAFDTLDHEILITKLKFYGLGSKSIGLLTDYLQNRKQFVDIDGTHSRHLDIITGVPQGSILGPLLFLIYINDIAASARYFGVISYADDTTLSCSFKSSDDGAQISLKINEELTKLYDWLTVNKLSLNISKTKYMIFAKSSKNIQDNISLHIKSTILERVNIFNFLGVTIDSDLSWKSHINKIAGKISRTVGILARLKHQLPQSVLLNIYNGLVVPQINYSILCWGFVNTKRIFLLQKKAIRFITQHSYLSHTAPLFKSLKLLNVDDIFLSALLKFNFKLENNDVPVFFATFDFSIIDHGHHTRFRSCNFPDRQKNYTRACLRFGLFKLLQSLKRPTGSIDTNTYKTTFQVDKITSKPKETIHSIISKFHTHSFQGFSKYIKIRFLEFY